MSVYPLVHVALSGDRLGFVIAALAHEGEEELAPSRQVHRGRRLVVGNVYRVSADGEPEAWKAWLWPVAGGDTRTGQSCEAAEAASAGALGELLQKRAWKHGPWWQGGAA
jgi:hypothetical protein